MSLFEKLARSDRNVIIGYYPTAQSAGRAHARLYKERFFRSAIVSVSAEGRRSVSTPLYAKLLFACLLALVAILFFLASDNLSPLSVAFTASIWITGLVLSPSLGLGLRGSVVREYDRRVLPGEAALLVECKPPQTERVARLLQTAEITKPAIFVIRPYLDEPWRRMRLDRESLSAEQLRLFATMCAQAHRLRPAFKPKERILHRLKRWEGMIEQVRRDLSEAVALEQSITPSAEWLLDNAYIIQNHMQEIRRNLPRRYYEILPMLDGDTEDTRVLRLALDLSQKTDGSITPASIYNFFSSYQGIHPLTIAELWTLPLMLRYALVEDLAHQSLRVSRRQHDRERADFWANRLISAAHRGPDCIPAMLADLSASVPAMEPHFLIRLIGQVSEEESVFAEVQKWLQGKLDASLPETIRTEHARQAKKQLSIANDITTLRRLGQIDWREIFESISIVEAVLEQDAVYSSSDFVTRNRCRQAVEEVARYSNFPEIDVAKRVIQLSCTGESERSRNAAYFLIDKGRETLERLFPCRFPVSMAVLRGVILHAGLFYFGSIALAAAALLGTGLFIAAKFGAEFWMLFAIAVTAVWPASEVALQIVNRLASIIVPPRFIPKMSFEAGIPEQLKTLVVVPTMLISPESIRDDLDALEVRYLANPEINLGFALLTDFTDSSSELTPEDEGLYRIARDGIMALNARYRDGRFFLFHRDRTWCETESCWLGWERKRGKLEDLNRFLNGEPRAGLENLLKAGNRSHLEGTRYVITLDSDTELPPKSALHLIEAMAHPLNRPVICPDRHVVCDGYGVIQPRVITSLPSSTVNLFTIFFANTKGTDPYAQAISDIHQDLFGEGIFVGKAIYDLSVFHQVLTGRFPEQTLLSHDLIEGNYLRTGFDSTILLFENFPASYEAFTHRQHRWIRGDWQIADWIFSSAPDGDGRRERNPLSISGRWKIFDNLRRSLVYPANLLLLVGSWIVLPNSIYWNAFIAAALLIPALVPIPTRVRAGVRGNYAIWRDQWIELLRCAVNIAFLPHQAWISIDAIARALFRRMYSHRNLLQWVPAQSFRWRKHTVSNEVQWRTVLICAGGIVLSLLLLYREFSVWPVAVPYLLLWLASPAISYKINAPKRVKKRIDLSPDEILFLRRISRETWRYFDDFVGPQSNWLPPDNSQEAIRIEVAYRTSPTNIGLWLLSLLAAHDFGYLMLEQLVARLTASFDTLDKLEKFRGHLLNWYDIKTLQPLHPRYVSTVDSGNFLASLWTLEQGLLELKSKPVAGADFLHGIADNLEVLLAALQGAGGIPGAAKAAIEALRISCSEISGTCRIIWESTRRIAGAWEDRSALLPGWYRDSATEPKSAARISYWIEQVDRSIQSRMLMYEKYFGWVPLLAESPAAITQSLEVHRRIQRLLDGRALSVEQIADKSEGELALLAKELGSMPEISQEWRERVCREIAKAQQNAAGDLERIHSLLKRSNDLQNGMKLDFLYDADRELFFIGMEVGEAPLSSTHYDLLASEARLTSLIAVARGEVDPEHWQTLGRPFGVHAGRRVLFSWSGSMFEYLMPLLFTRTFENSLLHHACRVAVAAQIEYGRIRRVPWGISESAFSALDANQIYQYRAFGVPSLGLKRDLGDDLVIAPYSTLLALMIEPVESTRNLKALENSDLHGDKGFYEAIDYSRESREGKRGAVVYAYMAHHQGMSFLALNNALYQSCMQRRFHSDLRVRAAEFLLYEGIPSSKIVSNLSTNEERIPARLIARPVETVISRSSDEKTPIPKTHLLSNGSYSIMVTNSGGGYSRWRDNDITRWRADTTRDHWGAYCYVRDLDSGAFWSTTHHPTAKTDSSYSVLYHSDRVEFRNLQNGIESIMAITVSPEDDVEVRRIVLVNRSGEKRHVDLTTYSELVLAPHAADRAHPAFNKLFVQTEILQDRSALLAFRNTSTEDVPRIWVGQLLASSQGLKSEYETSRDHFIGRGRGLGFPRAMSAILTNTSGPVLDPIFSIRKRTALEAGEKVQFAVMTLAADSREKLLSLMDKYGDLESADRVFELAWTHAQLSFRYLRIQHEDARHFQELAAHMLYPNASLRPGAERLRRNSLGQSRLWTYGISGDLPMCVLVVSDPLDLGTVRETLQAHTFWHERGLKSDLVILNYEAAGYDQPLQQRLLKLIQIHSVNTGTDKPGGVFLRAADQIPGDDLTLILSTAHIVLMASRGSLMRQMSSRELHVGYSPYFSRAVQEVSAFEDPQIPLSLPSLTFFNGSGGFSSDGREYVSYLDGDKVTPAPWINVMANPDFGSLMDETGQGMTWHLNSQLNRISPWHNDPVAADLSSAAYVRDEDTGAFWSPAAAPIRGADPYRIHHGQGYSTVRHNSHGIEHELTLFVPADNTRGAPVRLEILRLRNHTTRRRRLTVFFYSEWVLGRDREETQLHVICSWDPISKALLARNAFNTEFSGNIAFAATIPSPSSYTADRTEFLGRNGSTIHPAALARQYLSGRTGAGLDPCAALQLRFFLDPGQETVVGYILGETGTVQDARALIDRYSDLKSVERSLDTTRDWWDGVLGTIQVSTPEKSADFLLNRWLPYQTLSCRIWGRSGLYQSGGAFGFRDQLQDVMALVYAKPEITREQILRAAAHQFVEGDVQHWWHPQSGAGVRTRCSDDLLWLPYVTAFYVQVTGDATILEERIPFLESQPLGENEMEIYSAPSVSMSDGTLFEHCWRAVEKGYTSGNHELPLIGLCDWNDGFNRVGTGGKGESIWLAWFLIEVLRGFGQLSRLIDRPGVEEMCNARIRRLESALERHGWDGEWYRRAYFDDGSPLGSHGNAECRIDSLAQTWAAISGAAPQERIDSALHAVEEHLIRDADRLVLLFTPPFQNPERNPGYVRAYPPGVRENGGQYTHAAVWVAMAMARTGNGKRAVELLRMLNPIELTRSPAGVARYKCEPYALAGDVYSLDGRIGQGGWSWYTGSSSWMYRVWIEEVLGFQLRGNRLTIDPTIPAQWPGFEINFLYRDSRYNIDVTNPERTGRGIAWIELDGHKIGTEVIPLVDDKKEHRVQVRLGRIEGSKKPLNRSI